MHRVLVLGAGKIGALISGLLADAADYQVELADLREDSARAVAHAHGRRNLTARLLDATDAAALARHLREHHFDAVVSSLPYYCNPEVARAAREHGLHYFDLTEDVEITRAVRGFADGAATAFVPQCGLGPGFVSIAANELISHFEDLKSVKMRVGALGLINEYGNPCHAIADGRLIEAAPLEGLEEIEIDGTLYEAFNTSGGLGSLGETFGERCEQMNYKTMRYPGHCEQMRLLMNDLKLNQDRGTLKRILENAVPQTLQDVVIVYVAVSGRQDGELREENYVNKIYPQQISGRLWSAIQVTTAAGVTAVVDLVLARPERFRGYVRQEQFRLPEVLSNRFGLWYQNAGDKAVSARMVVEGDAGRQRSLAGAAR